MAEFLFKKSGKCLTLVSKEQRDEADYQCFYNMKQNPLHIQFSANFRKGEKYISVKEGSKLWNQLLQECIKSS